MDSRMVNAIQKGIVIDHIRAGLGIKLYHYLRLDEGDFTVVLIVNAASKRLERKDMIKIQNIVDLDYKVIGLIDNNATISIIENGAVSQKVKLTLPQTVENVISCKNPRCVTSIEEIPHVFHLQNEENRAYRCAYCEERVYGFQL
ncbi:aspartate carbamoyltransferase regulatory chain [Clostridia bacterium]|nr:aspartate carbamoyltransferase regulatory chain [Clostridia bacterium]